MPTGIVIPTYRESENIARLVGILQEIAPDAHIVVVDDSPDNATVDAVAPLVGSRVSLIHRETKDGRGSAVLAGLRHLLEHGCDRVVEMDADFSHDPNELPTLLRELGERDRAMVIGSRYLPQSRIERWPLSRRLFSRAANLLARFVLRVPISDYTNGYRAYTHEAARTVSETCGKLGRGFIALSETLVNLYYRGYQVREVPTVFINRARGESSVTMREVREAFFGLFRIYFLKRRLT